MQQAVRKRHFAETVLSTMPADFWEWREAKFRNYEHCEAAGLFLKGDWQRTPATSHTRALLNFCGGFTWLFPTGFQATRCRRSSFTVHQVKTSADVQT